VRLPAAIILGLLFFLAFLGVILNVLRDKGPNVPPSPPAIEAKGPEIPPAPPAKPLSPLDEARKLLREGASEERLAAALERRLEGLPTAEIARASLDAGGLIIVYKTREEAVRIANAIAPEHLELQVPDPQAWIPALKNYGSLFTGASAAEVLGDYSAGINHTLPTSGSARFSGGLSVRHFLKTVTTLRCSGGSGYSAALEAAAEIARAEGLEAHRQSALARHTQGSGTVW
jgi:histidinol dehydrogenase